MSFELFWIIILVAQFNNNELKFKIYKHRNNFTKLYSIRIWANAIYVNDFAAPNTFLNIFCSLMIAHYHVTLFNIDEELIILSEIYY